MSDGLGIQKVQVDCDETALNDVNVDISRMNIGDANKVVVF